VIALEESGKPILFHEHEGKAGDRMAKKSRGEQDEKAVS
jgi:hypothetical protein